MKAKIICDASFDGDYGIAGYAGSVHLISKYNNDVRSHYQGTLSGVKSSNESELNAIYEGLKEAIRNAPRNDKVRLVNIYSDSLNSIERIENTKKKLKRSDLEYYLLKKIRTILKSNNIKIFCHHVKAHQKNSEATPLEKLHNRIDKKAYRELESARKTFQKASENSKQSSKCSVILDGQPSQKMGKMYRELAYKLAKSGMSVRVSLQGEYTDFNNHPFYQGIQDYAIEAGKSTNRLINQVHWKKGQVHGFNDRVFGCQGMDSCMYRIHQKEKMPAKKIDTRSDEANRAGAASRLIFGYQSRSRTEETAVSNYDEEPSKFVLDLSLSDKEKKSVSYWAKEFADELGIKFFRNMKELQNDNEVNLLNDGLSARKEENLSYGT